MSAHRYTFATTICFGADGTPGYSEVEVEVEYSVAWGTPESGRYGPPEDYDPGSGDEVEDIKLILVEGQPRPWGVGWGRIPDDEFEVMVVERLENHWDDMIRSAIQEDEARRDSYLESIRDDR